MLTRREFSERDDTVLTQLASLASVAISNASALRARAHDRPDPPALAAPRRPAGRAPACRRPCASARRARASSSAATSTTSSRPWGGTWAALIGDVQGKGPDAAAVTALARHTLRAGAVYEREAERCARTAPQGAARASSDGRFCTARYAHLRIGKGRLQVELACGGHPLPLVVHPDGHVEPVGRLGTLLGTDIEPQLYDVDRRAPVRVTCWVLYTDGVTEVRRRRREVFGLAPADRPPEHVRGRCRPTRSPTASRPR